MEGIKDTTRSKEVNLQTVIKIAGALCAYWIGSGYATGQELLQYYTSFGSKGILGLLVTYLVLLYITIRVFSLGNAKNFDSPFDAYKYYLGPYVGTFYEYFNAMMIYGIYVIMLTGCGAVLNQHFGVSEYVGIVGLSVLAMITVLLGLEKIVDLLGKMGPVIIVISIIMGLAAIAKNPGKILDINQSIANLSLKKAAPHWSIAGFLYATLNLASGFVFMISCGPQAQNQKEARVSGILGVTAFCAAILVTMLSQFIFINDVAMVQIPTLVVVEKVAPFAVPIFLFILLLSIYNTAVPLLWVTARKFAPDKSKKFYIVTIILTIIGLFGGAIPFDVLLNILYPLFSYCTIILLVAIIIKTYKEKRKIS